MQRYSRRLPLAVLGVGALLLARGLAAAPPSPGEISNPEITAEEVRAHVRYLASDELQGRGSGTPGNDEAADYIAGRFRAAGLAPAGESGTFFQQFPVIAGVKLGEGNRLTLRIGKTSETLQPALSGPRPSEPANPQAAPPAGGPGAPPPPVPGEQPLTEGSYMPLSYSKNGTVFAPVVFAGYGISKPDLEYDDYKGLDVRGKIVVVLRHTPDADDAGKFGPYALLTYKTMTAREKGAAGIILVTGPLNEKQENLGVFSIDSASADCGIPAVFLRHEYVDRMLASTGKTLRDLQIMIAHGKTQSAPLPGVRAGISVNVVKQVAQTRNVLGLLEGSDPKLKDEIVVVGAHYDHLGMGGSHSLSGSNKAEIHHGADDNASGTAGVLELAQWFGAHREKLGRSLLFMSFSGEEMGLLGSAYWTKKPTIPLERVAAMINLDMIGRMKNDTVSILGAGSSPAWQSLVEEASKGRGIQVKSGGGSGFGGSDQQSFYAKQVPVLFFFTGVHPDYHKPSDTWDKINAEGEAKLLGLVADTAERISRLPTRPAYTKAQDQEPSSGPSFRVYLGTIPDYAEEVEGVALQGVREGSPAEKGGLRAGDVIVEFNGKKIRNVQEYTAVLADVKPNEPVKIVVLRKGQRTPLTVTPAARR